MDVILPGGDWVESVGMAGMERIFLIICDEERRGGVWLVKYWEALKK